MGRKLKKEDGVGEGKRERKRKRGAWKFKSTGLGVWRPGGRERKFTSDAEQLIVQLSRLHESSHLTVTRHSSVTPVWRVSRLKRRNTAAGPPEPHAPRPGRVSGGGRPAAAAAEPPGLPVQRRQVLRVAGRVGSVGDDAQDGALQRRALEQAAPHQLQVAGRVHAGAHGGARQQHALVREQKREAARDLDGAQGWHGDGPPRRESPREPNSRLSEAYKATTSPHTPARRRFRLRAPAGPRALPPPRAVHTRRDAHSTRRRDPCLPAPLLRFLQRLPQSRAVCPRMIPCKLCPPEMFAPFYSNWF